MNKKIATILAGIMAAVLVLSLMLSLLATVAHGATSGEIKDEINALKQQQAALDAQIRDLENNLTLNNNEIRSIISRKNGIDQQVLLINQQISLINQTISAQNLQIADTQEELDLAEERLSMLNETYAERIRIMEEQGDISYWSVIFKATSFADLLSRITMVVEIARADQRQLEQLRQVAQQVEQTKWELELAKEELQLSKVALRAEQEALFVKNSEAEGLLLVLIEKGGQYQIELDANEKKDHDLMNEIAHKQELYDEKLYEEWLATSVPPTTTTAPTTATTKPDSLKNRVTNTVNGITWVTPTKDFWVSSKFGNRYHPISGKWKMHNGIDMAAVTGTPIYATRSGKVTVTSYEEGGAGWYVCINHGDGYASIYMHMDYYIVKPGQQVEAGQIIGYVGSSGGSTGPHLHFGISYKGTYVNPQDYIKT